MSPTSYQTAPPRNKDAKYRRGLEGCQPLARGENRLEKHKERRYNIFDMNGVLPIGIHTQFCET